ncbi:MAG: hypothetical protein MZV64_01920 [Ignavibacteriales bacterium]|nr:hypothetical protein [Ignavibacteriales bacterium]
MKFLTAFLVLLITLNFFPQADLTIDLYLHGNFVPPYGGDATISFGLDSTATDGIDTHLGESYLPPDMCPTWRLLFQCAEIYSPPF